MLETGQVVPPIAFNKTTTPLLCWSVLDCLRWSDTVSVVTFMSFMSSTARDVLFVVISPTLKKAKNATEYAAANMMAS